MFSLSKQIQTSDVIIHAIAISDQAEIGMSNIALKTGGQSFFFPDTDTSNAINEAFQAIDERSSGTFM